MIFRSEVYANNKEADDGNKIHSQAVLSKEAGRKWRELDKESKASYKWLAAQEKERHLLDHPGYRYNPRSRRLKEPTMERQQKFR
jgi:hypothetical protein